MAGVQPLRLFRVLWPLWQVQTTANVLDEQAYEVFDHFLARAVAEAELHRPQDIASFFGVPPSLIHRCLDFLSTIGHVRLDQRDGQPWVDLTDLGRRSVQAGVRYVAKESQQDLLIEQFTAAPLPRAYYHGSIPLYDGADATSRQGGDSLGFTPLFAATAFRPALVEQLAEHPDRVELNLPRQLRDLRVIQERDTYLPVHVIETADAGLLVYTPRAVEPDPFFQTAIQQVPTIHNLIEAEDIADPQQLWTRWLADRRISPATLHQLDTGIWRATVRADRFGPDAPLRLHQLGSYELRDRSFIQLWCDDQPVRTRAALERALAMTRQPDLDLDTFTEQLAALAEQLEVTQLTQIQLRDYGRQRGLHEDVTRLEALR